MRYETPKMEDIRIDSAILTESRPERTCYNCYFRGKCQEREDYNDEGCDDWVREGLI